MEVLIYVITAIASIFIWNVIHEMSHILMAMIVGNIKDWSIKPYPHIKNGNFIFAGAEWTWIEPIPNREGKAFVGIAPRIANILAAFLSIIGIVLTGMFQIIWLILCFAGMVDLIVGSLGISETSDLKKVSSNLEISPWWLRISGFTIAVVSIIGMIVNIFII